jgi:hypothetical protein
MKYTYVFVQLLSKKPSCKLILHIMEIKFKNIWHFKHNYKDKSILPSILSNNIKEVCFFLVLFNDVQDQSNRVSKQPLFFVA